uniref:guanylate cyclase n=1 Tax=Strigamia maritima TaxID=126957 RepID=T1IL80_STRMM
MCEQTGSSQWEFLAIGVGKNCINGECVQPNYCKCYIGYHGESCQVMTGVLVIAIAISFLVVTTVLDNLYKQIKQEELLNTDWLVDWKEVTEKTTQSNLGTVYSNRPSSTALPNIPRTTKIDTGTPHSSRGETSITSTIENAVVWKGKDYYAKKIVRDSVDIGLPEIRQEIMLLRGISHNNLVRFFGICPVAPNVALLIEIMPKESLDKILHNEIYNLSWAFKFSILRDIVNGMEYLHATKLMSHGRLKTANCLIDNKWTCKVSGELTTRFGVPSIRKSIFSKENHEEIKRYFAFIYLGHKLKTICPFRYMIWTAPELLRVCLSPNDIENGTKHGDIFSFGIILTEVCSHKSAYFSELQILSIDELLRLLRNFQDVSSSGIKKVNNKVEFSLYKVCKSCFKFLEIHNYDTSRPIRPALKHLKMPESYSERKGLLQLILETTSEEPTSRPSFSVIAKRLNSIHPLKGELIENLIFMLEKYSHHLQEILNDKIIEIQSEKTRTEELISRFLPPSVAQLMKQGHDIIPEWHDNVSIFYSDIVGFTGIAKESRPMQVVELLNDLYTCFDSIIERFQVYKLETIGDAYCVVSGIPTPNQFHYEEIATMALCILSAITTFPIRHMPQKVLEIRIGIHSGSCVTAVLGVKMPRYCIFGDDTVCYTTRTWKSQFSEVLHTLTSTISTYWLVGKKGFDNALPGTPFLKTQRESDVSFRKSDSIATVTYTKSETTLEEPKEIIEVVKRSKISMNSTESPTLIETVDDDECASSGDDEPVSAGGI